MKMRKGGVIIDVPETSADFYKRAGYAKVEEAVAVPEPVVEAATEPEPEPVAEPVVKVSRKKAGGK